MVFHRRKLPPVTGRPRIALVPGTFNPPTKAHRALLEAACAFADEAIAVVPRTFPHKTYHGASLEDRLEMLEQLSSREYSIAVADGGLFLEMCEELLEFSPRAEVWFACGRDAAERILNWDYGEEQALERMFARFQLLVAARGGEFEPPDRFSHRIERLALGPDYDQVSSTEIRARLTSGGEWRHLVPEPLVSRVEAIYRVG